MLTAIENCNGGSAGDTGTGSLEDAIPGGQASPESAPLRVGDRRAENGLLLRVPSAKEQPPTDAPATSDDCELRRVSGSAIRSLYALPLQRARVRRADGGIAEDRASGEMVRAD